MTIENIEPEKVCGNCVNRDGEECALHCGREIYLDEKPSWCLDWELSELC